MLVEKFLTFDLSVHVKSIWWPISHMYDNYTRLLADLPKTDLELGVFLFMLGSCSCASAGIAIFELIQNVYLKNLMLSFFQCPGPLGCLHHQFMYIWRMQSLKRFLKRGGRLCHMDLHVLRIMSKRVRSRCCHDLGHGYQLHCHVVKEIPICPFVFLVVPWRIMSYRWHFIPSWLRNCFGLWEERFSFVQIEADLRHASRFFRCTVQIFHFSLPWSPLILGFVNLIAVLNDPSSSSC